MVQWLFWVGLLLAPFYNVLLFRPANFEISVVDIPFLLAFVLWSLQILVRGRLRANLPLFLIVLFLVFSLFSAVLSVEVMVGLKRWGRTLIRVMIFVVMMPFLMSCTKRWRVYVVLFVIGGVLFGVLNYVDFFVSPQAFMRSFFANPWRPSAQLRFIYPETRGGDNYGHEIGHWQSAVILLVLGLFLSSSNRRGRIGWVALALPSLVTLLLSMTKSAWLGLMVGLLYMVYRLYLSKVFVIKRVAVKIRTRPFGAALLVVGAMALVGLFFWFFVLPPDTRTWLVLNFTFQDVSGVERLKVWQGLVPIILDHLLLGVGWNNLVATGLSADPHSWWLGILAETGLIGFILYGAAYALILYMVDRRSRRVERKRVLLAIGANAALLSLGVEGLFEMSFMWSLSVWFSIGLALFFSYRLEPCNQESAVPQITKLAENPG